MRKNSHYFLMISFRHWKSPKSLTKSNLVKQSSPWTQIIMESLTSSNFLSHSKLLWIVLMKNKRQNKFLISPTTHPIHILTMEVTGIPVWIIISTDQSQILICMGSLTLQWPHQWTHIIICILLIQINMLLIKECLLWICRLEAKYQKILHSK